MAGEDKASASLAGKIKRALNKAIIKNRSLKIPK